MWPREYQVRDSDHGLGRVFIPCGPWKPAYRDIMLRERIDGLRLSDSMGWRGQDVHFLSQLPFLRSAEIYSWQVKDFSVLSSLSELRLLGMECDVRGPIDFGPLDKLEVALLTWKSAFEGVLGCKRMKHLNVSSWPEVDLVKLGQMTDLRALFFQSRKLESLRGLSAFNLLEKLDIYGCPKLRTLEGVEVCQRLTSISVAACKVGDVSVLASLPGLRTVELDGCGDLKSLAPLSVLRDLERLSFDGSTRVLDGDLSFVEGLPKLRSLVFAPRRSYNRTRPQLVRPNFW
jgi:hypothetical protein